MARTMLTTLDNPYDPFKQYDCWRSFDEVVGGYYSSALLGRVVDVSPDFTEFETEQSIENAIDEICRADFIRPVNRLTGKETLYVKVREQN